MTNTATSPAAEFADKSDAELKSMIERISKRLHDIGKKLPDNGFKLKGLVQRAKAELERRRRCAPESRKDAEDINSKDRATGLNDALRADQETNQEVIQEVVQDSKKFKPTEMDEVPSEASCSASQKRAVGGSFSKSSSKGKDRKNQDITYIQNSFEVMMGKMLENSNALIALLTTMLERPKNIKAGLREELGKLGHISRSAILSLCVKMTEDDVVVFRELVDEEEKYEFLGMILNR